MLIFFIFYSMVFWFAFILFSCGLFIDAQCLFNGKMFVLLYIIFLLYILLLFCCVLHFVSRLFFFC